MVGGRTYGMIDEEATNSAGVRATYFIDPEGVIRRSSARAGHNARMAPAHDFKLKLARAIEPTGGPGLSWRRCKTQRALSVC
jgi:hypothetical protein